MSVTLRQPKDKAKLPKLPTGLIWAFPDTAPVISAEIWVEKTGEEVAVGEGETPAEAMGACLKMIAPEVAPEPAPEKETA